MDPYILEWSKTPQAQPYMEQARAILGGSNTGGFGAGDGTSMVSICTS